MTPAGVVATHTFHKVDGFDLDSVKDLAVKHKDKQLDYLVMSQGMATIQGFTPTKDGFDQKLSLHVYSRVILAQILAPTLAKSEVNGGGKVISVLSAGIHGVYPHIADDPTLEKNYSIKNAADAAGVYNDLTMDKLSRAHPNVSFTHAAPGFVNTNWGTEMPFYLRYLIRPLQVFGKSRQKCADQLGSSWLEKPAGFHLMKENGDCSATYATPAHTRLIETTPGWWEDTQKRLEKWLK